MVSGVNDSDDGWSELLRELGVEHSKPVQPPPLPASVEPPPLPHADDEFAPLEAEPAPLFSEAAEDDETDPMADELDADGDDAESVEEVSAVAEEETEEPKKRRRRRRRRKKKSSQLDSPITLPEDAGEESDEDDSREYADTGESEDPASSDVDAPTPEASRELIANWDVPSWETIVTTMLYRPGGR
jgi:hypothetical protein